MNSLDFYQDTKPSITITDEGEIIVVWSAEKPNGGDDILYSRWTGSGWEPEANIHPEDPYYEFTPVVSSGGGEVWASWERTQDTSIYSPSDIFIAHWNGSDWDPPLRVSGPDNWWDWFAWVDVDSEGNPHVVWCEAYQGVIYYRAYIDGIWTDRIQLNDPEIEIGWAPCISVARFDNLHVVWAGTSPRNEIFYRFYSQETGQWGPLIPVSQGDPYYDGYPKISADSPWNAWVVWEGKNAEGKYHVYASYYDGIGFSLEYQLDDGKLQFNEGPEVALDNKGLPWAIWTMLDWDVIGGIMYSHYIMSTPLGMSRKACGINLEFSPSVFREKVFISISNFREKPSQVYIIDSSGRLVKTLFTKKLVGIPILEWDGMNDRGERVARGIYFFLIQRGAQRIVKKSFT